jgi:hypothetical protein
LQHAQNPVDWYPWSEAAFEKAVKEDKPIFISIGYSTCHWCHVMEKESFEDEEVAKLLNEKFLSIKVDREERPDIDSIYMKACAMITGSCGWPLTIIATPQKRPFFAGNIFFTHEILTLSVNTVPYLLHPLGNAKLLFDRENTIKPLLKKITSYFDENPEIKNEWSRYYKQLKEEKVQFGHEKTTIIDVWNELEKRYSEGKIKRPFFNSFYLTNTLIFSLLKRFL